MDGNLLAAGAPGLDTTGSVETFSRSASSGAWQRLNTISPANGDDDVGDFGAAVDISVGSLRVGLVVGAPTTLDTQGFQISFGAAYYYELTGASWTLLGSTGRLQPPISALTAGGEYGSAVALAADVRRMAVGGPSISLGTNNIDNGQVFVYDYSPGDGSLVLQSTLDGPDSGGRFGASIALTRDGSRLLVGSPGASDGATPGSIYYYEWDAGLNDWSLLFAIPGETAVENTGTTVAIVSDDGETIATGGPAFGNNQGVVRVYRRPISTMNFWIQLGGEIIGEPGDFLGTSLTGFGGNGIVVGTASSSTFKAYEYDDRVDDWALVSTGPPLGSNVASLAISDSGNVAVGLENESVVFYGLRVQ